MNASARIFASVLVLVAAATTTSGCGALKFWQFHSASNLPLIDNPFPALEQLAVVPVVSATPAGASEDWTPVLERAVLFVEGIQQVRRVSPIYDDTGELPQLPPGTQGLLEIHVREFDAFYPPRAHLEVRFYVPPSAEDRQRDDLVDLERHGSPAAKNSKKREPWLRFERVYDASEARVARRIRRYAKSQGDWDRGMKPEEVVTRVSDRYMEFVFYEMLRDCFMGLEAKEEESDGFLRKLLASAAQ